MAPGVTLAVIGAILTFAVRTPETGIINWHIVGVILMLAGAGLIWHARRGTTHERVITRVHGRSNSSSLPSPVNENSNVVRETIQDRDHE